MRAGDLRPNPKNWRTHPKKQQDALRGLLAEVGYAVPAIARELPDGSLMLLDGHLRLETVGTDQMIPVAVLDVTDEEADKLLASIDPLSALAGKDEEKLVELLATVNSDSAAVQEMLAGLVHLGENAPTDPEGVELPAPKFEVLVTAPDEQTQAELLEELTKRGFTCRSLIS